MAGSLTSRIRQHEIVPETPAATCFGCSGALRSLTTTRKPSPVGSHVTALRCTAPTCFSGPTFAAILHCRTGSIGSFADTLTALLVNRFAALAVGRKQRPKFCFLAGDPSS